MTEIKKYHLDIMYKVLKRLYYAKKYMKDYLKTGGQFGFSDVLKFDNPDPDLRHPILSYSEVETKAFVAIFGNPLRFPKNFTSISPQDFIKKIEERIEFFRERCGMKQSWIWLGERNWLTQKPKFKRYKADPSRLIL